MRNTIRILTSIEYVGIHSRTRCIEPPASVRYLSGLNRDNSGWRLIGSVWPAGLVIEYLLTESAKITAEANWAKPQLKTSALRRLNKLLEQWLPQVNVKRQRKALGRDSQGEGGLLSLTRVD